MCWYRQLYGAKLYDNSDCFNILCKSAHIIFEWFNLVGSLNIYAYLSSDLCIMFDT